MAKYLSFYSLGIFAAVATTSLLASFQEKQRNTNDVTGRVVDGTRGSSPKDYPLSGIVVNLVSPKDELQASAKTDSDGRFKAFLETSAKYYRFQVYDPQDRYWSYSSIDPTPNDKKQYDCGDIPLYPQSKKLSERELTMQYLTSEHLKVSPAKADQQAGNQLQVALQQRYPESFPRLATNDTKAEGTVWLVIWAEETFKGSTGRYGNLAELFDYGLIDRPTSLGELLGYKLQLEGGSSGFDLRATPQRPGITGDLGFFADSSGKVRKYKMNEVLDPAD